MMFLLYGEDVLSSRQKLTAIQDKFLATNPPENLLVRSANELTIPKLPNLFLAQTLLGGKRLIVLKNILALSPAEFKTALLELIKPQDFSDTTVIFYESETFDKRQALYKFLNKPRQVQEFLNPTGIVLVRRVGELALGYGLKLTPAIVDQLIVSSQGDLLGIDNDLKKLSAFSQNRTLCETDIAALLPGVLQLNVFSALSALVRKDSRTFLDIFNQQLDKGEDIVKILGALTFQLRGAVQVWELANQGLSAHQIAARVGLHPFAVKQNLALVKGLTKAQLTAQYQCLVAIDHQLKTGACAPENVPVKLVTTAAL
ncbi:MAG: DNA polymerase III subunit delta [Patescibacteria group bacterium]|nr:DNA polymerase III subunit delta [Patescibacteria group bacterium]